MNTDQVSLERYLNPFLASIIMRLNPVNFEPVDV